MGYIVALSQNKEQTKEIAPALKTLQSHVTQFPVLEKKKRGNMNDI